MGKERISQLLNENKIEFLKRENGWVPYEKIYYEPSVGKQQKLRSILYDVGGTGDGTNELTELFGKKDIFDNPKPTTLIQSFTRYNIEHGEILLDFFSGSGTSAHSILKSNVEDGEGTQRRFIVVQLPEPCSDKSEAFQNGYSTIADIGKERLRRAAEIIRAETPTTKAT